MATPTPGGPRTQRGLGSSGLGRIRENLGRPQTGAGDEDLYGPAPARPLATGKIYVESSRVEYYNYDYSSQTLYVRFVKYSTPWAYEGVSSAIFEAFASSPSKGKFINSTLNYSSYRRASSSEASQFL